jgi:hypothetical protein
MDLLSKVILLPARSTPELSVRCMAGSAIIDVMLPPGCTAGTLTILSISGTKLADRAIAGPGRHAVTVPVHAGVHFLHLNAGGKTFTRRVLDF